MPGRGAGRIAELNPALDVIRLEFSDAKLPLSLVYAEKNLGRCPRSTSCGRSSRTRRAAALAEPRPGRDGPPPARELRALR